MGRYTGPWLLGLDVGTDSIGWAAFASTAAPERPRALRLLHGGVRLFDSGREPEKQTSRQRERGLKRRGRRPPRARKWRKAALADTLARAGIAPGNEPENESIHDLREKAVAEPLSAGALYTLLMYFANRRGFWSTRLEKREAAANATSEEQAAKPTKGDNGGEPDVGFWESAEETLRRRMKDTGAPTVGVLLARDLRAVQPIRMRYGGGAVAPTRRLLMEEFKTIRARQQDTFRDLDWDAAAETIFEQRPLRTVDGGPCRFFPEEERCLRAMPSAQEYLLRQTLANLRIPQKYPEDPRPLTEDEYDAGYRTLSAIRSIEWPMLRSEMGLRRIKFTIESERSGGKKAAKATEGNQTETILGPLIPRWKTMTLGAKDELVTALWAARRQRRNLLRLIADPDGPVRVTDPEVAEAIADAIQFDLPTGRLNISLKAARKIAAELRPGVEIKDAIKIATGQDHWLRGEEKYEIPLPYYAQALPDVGVGGTYDPADLDDPERYYGRVGNISVHIALNQIRNVVNALLDRYGPDLRLVVVETMRELKAGADERLRLTREQTRRERENVGIDVEIRKTGSPWIANARERRLRWRLWKRQNDLCPYCGNFIGGADLMSEACAIDHVIPRAMGGRDTADNMVVCHAGENARKGDDTPWKAFHADPGWTDKIADFLARLDKPVHKALAWRFSEKAATKAARLAIEDDGEGWAPRQDRDTSYIATVALRYLARAVPPADGNEVVATKGRLTAWLRTAWDLTPTVRPHDLFPIGREALESPEAAQSAVAALEPAHLRKAFEELVKRQTENSERQARQDNHPTPPDMTDADLCRAALSGLAGVKNRLDHRHHFIDAAVIAVTDRARVQWINTLYGRGGNDALPDPARLPEPLPEPYEGFVAEVRREWNHVWPSIRPRHGKGGGLHAETLYGVRPAGSGDPDARDLVLRRRVEALFLDQNGKPLDDKNVRAKIDTFASPRMRERFLKLAERKRAEMPDARLAEVYIATARDPHWGPRGMTGNTLIDAKGKTPDDKGVKFDFRGNPKTAVRTGGNEIYEIWENVDARGRPRWEPNVVTWFDAVTDRGSGEPQADGARRVMALRKGDFLWWPNFDGDRLFVVKKFDVRGRLFVWPARCATGKPGAPIVQGLFPAINLNGEEGYKFSTAEGLRKAGVQHASVSVLGRVRVT